MEVALPNGSGGGTNSSQTSVEIKKAKLNAGSEAKMCNGDAEPINGQNGDHAKEEEESMDVDEDYNSNTHSADKKGENEENMDESEIEKTYDKKSPECVSPDKEETEGSENDNVESKSENDNVESKSENDKVDSKSEKDEDGEDETQKGENSVEESSSKVSKDEEESNDAQSEEVKAGSSTDSLQINNKVSEQTNESRSVDDDSKPATPSTVASEESKPGSPSDKSKDPSTDRELDVKTNKLTEEDKQRAKDVDQREVKLKRIEDSAKDKDDLRPVAKLLFGIGVDLAAQHIYKDLVRAQSKKDAQNKLDSRGREQLGKLKSTYKALSGRNKSYLLKMKSCEKCGFKTESDNVIEWHLEFAHGQDAGKYECSFCEFETRLPAPFFFHMEAEHSRKGRVFMKKAFFSCPQCPYENNSKHSVTKHRVKCDKQFSLKRNQEPLPTDCDIPLKKPKSLVIKPTRSISKPLIASNQIKNYLDNKNGNAHLLRPAISSASAIRVNPNATVQSILSSQARGQVLNQPIMTQRPRIVTPVSRHPTTVSGPAGQMFALVNSPVMLQQNFQSLLTGVRQQSPQQTQPIQYIPPAQNISQIAQQVVAQVTQQHSTAQHQKAIQEILKRAQQPAPQPPGQSARPSSIHMSDAQAQAAAASNPKFEICEICGGFVKDRESLRIHFYWAHKVDIQKDVFARLNPHLKCDSCPQAFWTYQGLARHRQISHVKPRERTYRCYLCGAKNIENIITHLSMAHNVRLNTMYKTGKCLVCGLGFAGEKGLKRHIHTAHAELLKGQPDIVEPAPKPIIMKPATMPPTAAKEGPSNPVPTGLFENASKKKKFEPVCSLCNIVFPSVESFTYHCNKLHVFKCWRCNEKWASKELLHKHWNDKHRRDTESCVLCKESVTIGRPFVRHMKRSHLKECSVVLVPMKKADVDHYSSRARKVHQVIAQPRAEGKAEVIVLSDEEEDCQNNGEKEVKEEGPKGTETPKNGGEEKQEEEKESVLKEGGQEVMEVDGEKIVVEISQDDDDKESDSEKREIKEDES